MKSKPIRKLKTASKHVRKAASNTIAKTQRGYTRFARLPAHEVSHAEQCLLSCLKYGGGGMDETMAPGVVTVPLCVGRTPGGGPSFPRPWRRQGEPGRGDAVWCVPPRSDTRRRLLFLHGGAYSGASPTDECYLAFATQLAKKTGLAVLSIDYRLAPEHRCPAAVEDAVAALKWLTAYGPPKRGYSGHPGETSALKEKASQIFLCGDSAGGGLAFACAIDCPARVRAVLRGIAAISPWTDLTASSSTYDSRLWDSKTKTGDPFDDRPGSLNMAANYLGKGSATDPRASPMFASPAQLRALPPTLFLVGDYELGLGDSVMMHDKMVAAGHLDASISVYDRMFHCHVLYAEGKDTGEPLRAGMRGVQEITSWIKERSTRP